MHRKYICKANVSLLWCIYLVDETNVSFNCYVCTNVINIHRRERYLTGFRYNKKSIEGICSEFNKRIREGFDKNTRRR